MVGYYSVKNRRIYIYIYFRRSIYILSDCIYRDYFSNIFVDTIDTTPTAGGGARRGGQAAGRSKRRRRIIPA